MNGKEHIDMELINLDNVQAVLEEYGNEVRNLYQDKLILGDHISTGDLLNNVEFQVDKGEDGVWEVSLTLNHYWKYLERGVRGAYNQTSPYANPGWKAYPHILNWVKVKPVIPRPRADGSLPTPQQLAYLITRQIVANGTKPREHLAESIAEINEKYKDKLIYALREDSEVILKVLLGGIEGSLEN